MAATPTRCPAARMWEPAAPPERRRRAGPAGGEAHLERPGGLTGVPRSGAQASLSARVPSGRLATGHPELGHCRGYQCLRRHLVGRGVVGHAELPRCRAGQSPRGAGQPRSAHRDPVESGATPHKGCAVGCHGLGDVERSLGVTPGRGCPVVCRRRDAVLTARHAEAEAVESQLAQDRCCAAPRSPDGRSRSRQPPSPMRLTTRRSGRASLMPVVSCGHGGRGSRWYPDIGRRAPRNRCRPR